MLVRVWVRCSEQYDLLSPDVHEALERGPEKVLRVEVQSRPGKKIKRLPRAMKSSMVRNVAALCLILPKMSD
jgi:hypothetical protein